MIEYLKAMWAGLVKGYKDYKYLEQRKRLAAGWKKCCRCFPSSVTDNGYCRCCDFDNKTGERSDTFEPDYGFDTPVEITEVHEEVEYSSDGGIFTPEDKIWKICTVEGHPKFIYGQRCPMCIAATKL